MARHKSPISTGDPELDAREEKRLREREEEGLKPEQKVGPRQNEGISGPAYTTQEEADRGSYIREGEKRTDGVDRKAAHVLPEEER